MELEKTHRVIIGIFALLIGIGAGYAAAWSTAPEDEQTYCEQLQEDLRAEHQTDSLMCHEDDWVALAQSNRDIENRTDIKCVCTQVENGALTIFPIRTPE
jgi:hypothetical protein